MYLLLLPALLAGMINLFTNNAPYGQVIPYCDLKGTVYIEEDPGKATFLVYEEESEAFADLIIFETDNNLFADKPGIWYFVDNTGLADFSVCFVDSKGQADFTVYFTEFESMAGCSQQ